MRRLPALVPPATAGSVARRPDGTGTRSVRDSSQPAEDAARLVVWGRERRRDGASIREESRPLSLRDTTLVPVEDDPELRDVLSTILAQAGYAVATAGDGVEALACLRSTSLLDLIVLDLMLPAMDGFEFRVHQLQDTDLAAIPVIVLSAGDDLERKAQGLGAIATFRKPFDPDALLDQLGKVQLAARTRGAGADAACMLPPIRS